MLELPVDEPTDTLRLADWLELSAILSPDHNTSRGDLESVLRRYSFAELYNSVAIEEKIIGVFDELDQRLNASLEAYPYELSNRGVLQLKSDNWQNFPAYIFCLCLSYFGTDHNEPRKLFEHVSCLAAKSYLQGSAVGFGFPRTELPSSFPEAVTEICKLIGEGETYRDQPSLKSKDDTLDLVAWKDFSDRWPSKLLMCGQCASGWNWEGKLGELQPRAFWDNWIQDPHVSLEPLRSFFIPHRVDRSKWKFVARKSGVLFDRCRVAFWAHQEEADYNPHLEWINELFVQIAS